MCGDFYGTVSQSDRRQRHEVAKWTSKVWKSNTIHILGRGLFQRYFWSQLVIGNEFALKHMIITRFVVNPLPNKFFEAMGNTRLSNERQNSPSCDFYVTVKKTMQHKDCSRGLIKVQNYVVSRTVNLNTSLWFEEAFYPWFSLFHIVTRAGDNNFQSRSPTANGLITRLSTFSLLVHGKSTNTHRPLHNVSPLYTLYYEYIAHPVLAI